MIGKLTGRVDYVAEDHALIEAGGVGYLVHCADPTLAALSPGQTASLYTELVVREDLLQLYGFRSLAERDWHRLLSSVQGVGARVSLAILGALGVAGLARALAAGDAGSVRMAPGVGPKLANRIVTELKGKAPAMLRRPSGPATAAMPVQGTGAESPKGSPPAPAAQMAASPTAPPDAPEADAAMGAAMADALSALVNLGYDRAEAAEAVARAADGADSTEALIRAALRLLAPADGGR